MNLKGRVRPARDRPSCLRLDLIPNPVARATYRVMAAGVMTSGS